MSKMRKKKKKQIEKKERPGNYFLDKYIFSVPGILAIFFLLNLLAGIIYLKKLQIVQYEPFYDATLYIRGAQAVLTQSWQEMYYAKQLYQLYLAAVIYLFGEDIKIMRLFNLIIAAATCQIILVSVYRITKSRWWMVAAGLLLVLTPVQLIMAPYMLTENIYSLCLAALALILLEVAINLRVRENFPYKLLILYCIALIITSGMRPIGQYILLFTIPILVILAYYKYRNNKEQFVSAFSCLILVVGVFFLSGAALNAIFNTPDRIDNGEALWLGNLPSKYIGTYETPLGKDLVEAGKIGPPEFEKQVEKAFLSGLIPGSPEYDKVLTEYAYSNIRGDLNDTLQRTVYKAISYLSIKTPEYFTPGLKVDMVVWPIIIGAGVILGLVIGFLLMDWIIILPGIIFLMHWGIHSLTRVRERDTLGMYPILFIVALYGFYQIFTLIKNKRKLEIPANKKYLYLRIGLIVAPLLVLLVCNNALIGGIKAFSPPGIVVEKTVGNYLPNGDYQVVVDVKASQPYSRVYIGEEQKYYITDKTGRTSLVVGPDQLMNEIQLKTLSKSSKWGEPVTVRLPAREDYASKARVVKAPAFSPSDEEGAHDFGVAMRGFVDSKYAASINENPNIVVLELPKQVDLKEIQIVNYRSDIYMSSYKIDVSQNGADWLNIVSQSDYKPVNVYTYPVSRHLLGKSVKCRYVRLSALKTVGINRLLIRRFALYD